MAIKELDCPILIRDVEGVPNVTTKKLTDHNLAERFIENMNTIGNIIIGWPHGNDFDFDSKYPEILPLLLSHGFNHRSVSSSSFVLFTGTKDTFIELQTKLREVDSGFTAEWAPPSEQM